FLQLARAVRVEVILLPHVLADDGGLAARHLLDGLGGHEGFGGERHTTSARMCLLRPNSAYPPTSMMMVNRIAMPHALCGPPPIASLNGQVPQYIGARNNVSISATGFSQFQRTHLPSTCVIAQNTGVA